MSQKNQPEIEQWYLDTSRHCKFHIIDINSEYLELEYTDGELEQVNLSEWETWSLKKVTEPSEWGELAGGDMELDSELLEDLDWEGEYPDLAHQYHSDDE